MGFVGIGAVLGLLFTLITLRAKIRHDRAVRLIHQTPVTPIADVVQSAHGDPAIPTHAAVQGRVVARETTRLTAPITGSSCVAYEVRVYDPGDDENPDTNYIKDSKWVPWAIDDGTGLALVPFNPFEPPNGVFPCYWPGSESTGDTFKNNTEAFDRYLDPETLDLCAKKERRSKMATLDRVISHYGRERLPSPGGWLSPSYEDLSWKVSILKEFGNEVFLLGPFTLQGGCAHFELDSDSLLWFGSRADALSHKHQRARAGARWAKIWFIVSVILAAAFFYLG